MKLINSKVEILEQLPGFDGMTKQIEIAGRTCYKSEDKITEGSSREFVQRMRNSGHTAMLEHGTVYLTYSTKADKVDEEFSAYKYISNPYSHVNVHNDEGNCTFYITTNYRVIVENGWEEDLKYWSEPTEHHDKRIAVRFTCSRAIANEIVRHRVMSFAQESQRYCNYTKDKFANEVTFIIPSDIDLPEGHYEFNFYKEGWYTDGERTQYDAEKYKDVDLYLFSLNQAEATYVSFIKRGWKPQKARGVLPNDTKTEIVVTGFETDWQHFFSLRCVPSAHPDMQKLANELYFKLYNKEYAK